MELSVMTFNIHHGVGMDKQVNLERIAEVIQACDAHIVGLNEVDRFFSQRSDYVDQVKWLAEQLQMNYVFGPSISVPKKKKIRHPIDRHEYGNALLTRGDIQPFQNHVWKTFFRYTENRSILEATINVNGKQTVTMFIIHLSLNPLIQLKQVDFILDLSFKCQGPVLIAGDCNMRPGSRPWRRMNAHYADVWLHRENGCGYTYPSRRPRMRLDYIFVDKAFTVVDARVVRKDPLASDHLPVQAVLQLPILPIPPDCTTETPGFSCEGK